MASLGALGLPVPDPGPPTPSNDFRAVGDPSRTYLGEFLQAAMRASCHTAWTRIGGHSNVVERVETNDPADNTFATTKLPALFVYRENRTRQVEWQLSDMSYRTSTMTALWVPNLAVQEWKAKRESFWNAVEAAVMQACAKNRTPGWILDGETDAVSLVEGSDVSEAMGLRRPLSASVITFDDVTLTVEMLGAEAKRYPALKMSFMLMENHVTGSVGTTYPAALDLTLSNSEDEELGEIQDLPA